MLTIKYQVRYLSPAVISFVWNNYNMKAVYVHELHPLIESSLAILNVVIIITKVTWRLLLESVTTKLLVFINLLLSQICVTKLLRTRKILLLI